ncbi:MAG TPA: CbiX/SirB N-terminal domain-containing protein [Opitutaceae bacterium]|jgi:sirohydrochlorin ferrochelatase
MRIALIDNGSLEPPAHLALREVARAISRNAGADVEAVSWRHSDAIAPAELGGWPARTLGPWVRAHAAADERDFVLIPFFVSPKGAIGSLLRRDLSLLCEELGDLEFTFADGLADGPDLARIAADCVREACPAANTPRPAVVVVDHGGPSAESAAVRDRVAAQVRAELGGFARSVAAASMESRGPHSDPLLSALLGSPGLGSGDVVVSPLFLLPGRHAGPGGDLHRITQAAGAASPGLRCRVAGLVGTHPAAAIALSGSLSRALGAAAHA